MGELRFFPYTLPSNCCYVPRSYQTGSGIVSFHAHFQPGLHRDSASIERYCLGSNLHSISHFANSAYPHW